MIDPEEAEVEAWFRGRAERVFETATARVFLIGDAAFKVKRRVDLGYLDYSTLERRLWSMERELAFNRAAASDIYRAVRRVTRDGSGFVLDGPGETVEYALEMRRFDEDAVLSARPWAVDGDLADALGRTIARLHAGAALRPAGGGARALGYTIASNAKLLRGLAPRLGSAEVERLIAATDAAFLRLSPLLDARVGLGFARHCHADLHLGNILVEEGRPILFDCIEFNDVLSDIDVQYDLAFLLMDLDFRRRRDAAVRVLATWADEAARTFAEPVFDGLAALPLMQSVRAAVRAHVSANSGDDGAARSYVGAAMAHLEPRPARLVCVGGFSGTGKSTFARLAAPGLGAAPGALVLRTDEVRKRLAGAGPLERLAPETYTPAFYAAVYDALFEAARRALAAGWAVVLDATFIEPALRNRAERLAAEAGAPFDGVWLEAPAELLAARIGARTADASDATVATLQMQAGRDLGELAWTRVDATGDPAEMAERWAADHLR